MSLDASVFNEEQTRPAMLRAGDEGCRCRIARPDLGEWWPSRLVAMAAEDRLSIKRNLRTSFAAASDCPTIAIYQYTP
jgi:hypothetical protein